MAKIWLLQEGIPLKGSPVAEKTLPWCMDNLGLKWDHWLPSQMRPLVIGQTSHLSAFSNPRYVVVEIENQETAASPAGAWREGHYLAPVSVDVAKRKLQA